MKKKIICLCVAIAILASIITVILFFVSGKNGDDITVDTEAATITGEAVVLEDCKNTYENNGDLFINGQKVTDDTCVKIFTQKKRCVVSLMYVALSLGCEVYKNGEYEYRIVYGEDIYRLNTAENTMRINNNPMNIIGDPDPIINPNTESAKHHLNPYYKRTETDYLIDSNCINHFLYLLNYDMTIDYEGTSVSIAKVNNPAVKLVVNSKELPVDENVRINYKEGYAEIPLFSVLKGCGVEVKQNKDGTYALESDNKNYILDTKTNIISDKNCSDYFKLIVGGKVWYYFKATNNEYYISTDLIKPLLSEMGYITEVDFENSTITVYERAN
ncbi:MAG: hypothetical protein IKT55_05490 [Clostridia bacterium]|nr:hypothetical protein [Clostridia bacterium]